MANETKTKTTAPRRAKGPWFCFGITLAIAVLLGGAALVNWRNLEFERIRADNIEAQKLELQVQASGLRERLGELEAGMQEIADTGNQAAQAALRRQREMERARSQQLATLEETQAALTSARKEQETLAARAAELRSRVESLTAETESLRKSEVELRENLAQSQRLTDALRAEVKAKERTLASLETAYQRYKDANQESSKQLQLVTRTLSELEEINRRRARMLEQAARRVREISDNYRSMAVRIDADSRTQSTLNAEFSRLQSAALAVEDQLSQINNLNAQASRLERQLEKARDIN